MDPKAAARFSQGGQEKRKTGRLPLSVQARNYAEQTADGIYLRVWPIDAGALERALAAAYEAGWRARG